MNLNFYQCKQMKDVSHCTKFSHAWLYQIQMLSSTSLICLCFALKETRTEYHYCVRIVVDNHFEQIVSNLMGNTEQKKWLSSIYRRTNKFIK